MSHPVAPLTTATPETLLAEALAWGAPATVAEICASVASETVLNLVHAIDRRIYVAVKEHDERVRIAIDTYADSVRESMHLRTVGWVDR